MTWSREFDEPGTAQAEAINETRNFLCPRLVSSLHQANRYPRGVGLSNRSGGGSLTPPPLRMPLGYYRNGTGILSGEFMLSRPERREKCVSYRWR